MFFIIIIYINDFFKGINKLHENLLKLDDIKRFILGRDLTENEHYADWLKPILSRYDVFVNLETGVEDVMKIGMKDT